MIDLEHWGLDLQYQDHLRIVSLPAPAERCRFLGSGFFSPELLQADDDCLQSVRVKLKTSVI